MLLSIPIAVGCAFYRIEWFFPAMLFVIGGRYLIFSTLYGRRLYWVLAVMLVMLVMVAWVLLGVNAPAYLGAISGGIIYYI